METVTQERLIHSLALGKPLSTWPTALFDALEIKDPNRPSNLSIVLDALEATEQVPGDIVECGVYRGSSLSTLGLKVKEMKLGKRVWGLDSFNGFPPASPEDWKNQMLPETSQPAYFSDTSKATVEALIHRLGLEEVVRLVEGYFHETCPTLAVRNISLLWLDCDLYASYMTCLEHLYPRVSPGGRIIFDEYYSRKYPGARIAVDRFFADKPETPQRADLYLKDSPYERWFLIKQAVPALSGENRIP